MPSLDGNDEPPADLVDGDQRTSGSAIAAMFTINVPKPSSDEDAPPIAIEVGGCWFVAALDGLGGSGGRSYVQAGEPPDAPIRTGAYLASRSAQAAVLHTLGTPGAATMPIDELGRLIVGAVEDSFATLARSHSSASRIASGGVIKIFPTTFAMARVARAPFGDQVDLLWAGDSRVYALDPTGLRQLTIDHLKDAQDAFDNIRSSASMSNCFHAGSVALQAASVVLDEPAVVFAASDGCFGYWPSPMHLELALLRALHTATDVGQWMRGVEIEIGAITQDDSTLALVVVGETFEFDTFKASLAARFSLLAQQLNVIRTSDVTGLEAFWRNLYQRSYERNLPAAVEESELLRAAPDPVSEPASLSASVVGHLEAEQPDAVDPPEPVSPPFPQRASSSIDHSHDEPVSDDSDPADEARDEPTITEIRFATTGTNRVRVETQLTPDALDRYPTAEDANGQAS